MEESNSGRSSSISLVLLLRLLGVSLLNFVPWLLKCLPETSDPLMGSWLASKMKTLLRIFFSVFLLSSHGFSAALPLPAQCPHLPDGQSGAFREVI